jgi:hypothetical protein
VTPRNTNLAVAFQGFSGFSTLPNPNLGKIAKNSAPVSPVHFRTNAKLYTCPLFSITSVLYSEKTGVGAEIVKTLLLKTKDLAVQTVQLMKKTELQFAQSKHMAPVAAPVLRHGDI